MAIIISVATTRKQKCECDKIKTEKHRARQFGDRKHLLGGGYVGEGLTSWVVYKRKRHHIMATAIAITWSQWVG